MLSFDGPWEDQHGIVAGVEHNMLIEGDAVAPVEHFQYNSFQHHLAPLM